MDDQILNNDPNLVPENQAPEPSEPASGQSGNISDPGSDQIFNSDSRSSLPTEVFEPQTSAPWYKNLKAMAFVSAFLVVALAAGWYFVFGRNGNGGPPEPKVKLIINGPAQVSSNTETEFKIVYTNNESADLTNVHLDLIYPSNFQFKSSSPAAKTSTGLSYDLPMVKRGESGELIIRAKMSGATGETKSISGKFSYKLSNFNSNFQVESTYTATIQAPNLAFDITGPAEVPAGQDTTFSVNYSNVSNNDYDNVAVTITYPPSFKFTAASVPPSKNNNYWSVGKLPKGAQGTINISGSFIGQSADEQLVTGQLGQVINGAFASQITSTATFRLKSAPLSVTQRVNPSEVVNVGDTLQFTINYENEGSIGLTNITIVSTLSSPLIDAARLSVSDATITGTTITWRAATNPNLSILTPGKVGQVTFSVPLKQTLSVSQKNQVIKNSVTITSAEVPTPIRAQDIELKLGSKLTLDVVGDYVSGANPLQVGKSTTFSMTFLVTNASNDLTGTEVVASMPLPPSAWNNVVIPESEKSRLSFDPTSGLIRWSLGNVQAFAGKLTPAPKVTFQIVVTPGISDQGQAMKLLSNVSGGAFDSFTNKKLSTQNLFQYTTSDIDDFGGFGVTVQP